MLSQHSGFVHCGGRFLLAWDIYTLTRSRDLMWGKKHGGEGFLRRGHKLYMCCVALNSELRCGLFQFVGCFFFIM